MGKETVDESVVHVDEVIVLVIGAGEALEVGRTVELAWLELLMAELRLEEELVGS